MTVKERIASLQQFHSFSWESPDYDDAIMSEIISLFCQEILRKLWSRRVTQKALFALRFIA